MKSNKTADHKSQSETKLRKSLLDKISCEVPIKKDIDAKTELELDSIPEKYRKQKLKQLEKVYGEYGN